MQEVKPGKYGFMTQSRQSLSTKSNYFTGPDIEDGRGKPHEY